MRFLLLAFISSTALAQVPGSLGYMPTAQFQTSRDMTIYVSPDGGDYFACGSSSAPCKTLEYSWLKIPQNVNHIVTLNFAAGVYDMSASRDGGSTFVDGGTIPRYYTTLPSRYGSGQIVIQGAKQTILETGAGTYTAPTFPAPPTITDSSKSWDAGQGDGYPSQHSNHFFVFTQADGGFDQKAVRPISTNSATQLYGNYFSFGTTTSTYAIVTPSTVFTRNDLFFPVLNFGNQLVRVDVNDVEIRQLTGYYAISSEDITPSSMNASTLTFTRVLASASYSGGGVVFAARGAKTLSFVASSIFALPQSLGGNTSVCIAVNNAREISAVDVSCVAQRGAIGSQNGNNYQTTGLVRISYFTATIQNLTENYVFWPMNFYQLVLDTVRTTCSSSANSMYALRAWNSNVSTASFYAKNCSVGLTASSGARLSCDFYNGGCTTLNHYFTNVANPYRAEQGGVHYYPTAFTPSITTSTNDITVDGQNTSWSTYSGLSPKTISGQLGSRFGSY